MNHILDSIRGLKVAVIGDIMLDHYVWGDAERISPEAPVPVIDVVRDSYVPGGAANVALNAKSLGANVSLIGSISNDDAGAELMAQLNEADINFDPRFARNLAPTIVKTRIIVRNQQLCRLDREEAPSEYAIEEDELWSLIEEKLSKVDAVILSDYHKGVIDNPFIERIKSITEGKKTLLALDPKPRRRLNFSDLDLVTPNQNEALILSKVETEPHQKFPAEAVCQALWEKYRSKNLVVTLGGDGMLLSKYGSDIKFMPTVAREVYDVSGAGDTVIAALTLGLATGARLEDAAHFANIAAGIVVSKIGTATVTPREMLDYELSSCGSTLA